MALRRNRSKESRILHEVRRVELIAQPGRRISPHDKIDGWRLLVGVEGFGENIFKALHILSVLRNSSVPVQHNVNNGRVTHVETACERHLAGVAVVVSNGGWVKVMLMVDGNKRNSWARRIFGVRIN